MDRTHQAQDNERPVKTVEDVISEFVEGLRFEREADGNLYCSDSNASMRPADLIEFLDAHGYVIAPKGAQRSPEAR